MVEGQQAAQRQAGRQGQDPGQGKPLHHPTDELHGRGLWPVHLQGFWTGRGEHHLLCTIRSAQM